MGPAPKWEKAGREWCADPGAVACWSGSFQRHRSIPRLPTLVWPTPALTGTWRALTLPPAAPQNVPAEQGASGASLQGKREGKPLGKRTELLKRGLGDLHVSMQSQGESHSLHTVPSFPRSYGTLLPPEHHSPSVRVPYARWEQDKDAPQLQPACAQKGQTNCRHQSSRDVLK